MSAHDPAARRIRPANPGDLAVVMEFNRLLALETESKTLDQEILRAGVERALADPELARYWVAERGDPARVVGQAAITREWSDWRCGWIWWFQSVYVAQSDRGRGVFRALYNHVRAQARADSEVVGLRLYVEESNTRAQAVYHALGMRPGGYHVFEDLWIADRKGPRV